MNQLCFTLNVLQLGIQFKIHMVFEGSLGKERGKLTEHELLVTAAVVRDHLRRGFNLITLF